MREICPGKIWDFRILPSMNMSQFRLEYKKSVGFYTGMNTGGIDSLLKFNVPAA
jgi:hypothetical protein